MKLIKYFIAACSILFSFSAFAEYPPNGDFSVKDIKQITDRVYSPNVLSGRFVQEKNIKDIGITLKSEGRFSIDKSKGIKWVSEKPISNTIIIEDNKICMDNGSGITVIDSDSNQTMKHIVGIMRSLLTQDYEVLQEHFVLYADICDGFGITMVSKDSLMSSMFTKLTVVGSHYVDNVVFENKEGDVTKITFIDVVEKIEEFSCEQH